MMDIVYCPRRHCQYPVTRDPDDNIARCPVCQYAFCVRCKMVYHGVEPCKISSGMCLNFVDICILDVTILMLFIFMQFSTEKKFV